MGFREQGRIEIRYSFIDRNSLEMVRNLLRELIVEKIILSERKNTE